MFKFLGCEATSSWAIIRPTNYLKKLIAIAAFLFGIATTTGGSNVVSAQTVTFGGVQGTVPTGTLNYASGVAVDSSGNVYVANSGLGTVLKETLTSGGTYTESTIGNGLYFPGAIAVDANGNLYIADTDNNRAVKETLSGGAYSQSTIASGLATPYGIAVDGSGNVYIADTGNSRVLMETPSGGSYTQAQIITGSFRGVAVDASGNLYLTDTNHVYKETLSIGTYTQNTIASGIGGAFGVAVDNNGIVHVADTDTSSAGRLLEEIPTSSGYSQVVIYSGAIGPLGIAVDWRDNVYVTNIYTNTVQKFATSGATFGSQAIGVPSSILSLTFTFSSGGAIAAPAVLTQGATGLDFTDAGTGTCTTNGTTHTYNAGDSCTVNVVFTPRYSGTRYGAANILNSSNTVIATGYLLGTGVGPHLGFLPGAQSTIASGSVSNPLGVAVDASGDLFIADFSHNQVLKETPAGAGYTASAVVTTTPNSPSRVAVDGSGNIYVYDAAQVLKETPTGGGYVQSVIMSDSYLAGLAVDGFGNVYVTDYMHNAVFRETPTTAGYIQTTVSTTGLFYPFAIAVDGSGNVYIADPNNLRVVKETLLAGDYIQSTIPVSGMTNDAQWIAVDANGSVYISDFGSKLVFKETLSSNGYTQSTLPASGLTAPAGVAIDGRGNVFIADTNNNQVVEEDFANSPTLTFASTAYGATSADSPQVVTIQNNGNGALTFPVPASGNNPSIPSSFVLNGSASSACPIVNSGSSAAGMLGAGESCELSVSFIPAGVGAIGGSLVLTDNALNAAGPNYATQSIALSGTAIQATPTDTVSSSAVSAFASTSVTFTATIASSSGSPTGAVTFFDAGNQLGTATLSGGKAAYTTSSLTAGAHSITAAYSGDSNFAAVTSAVLTETVVSLTITGATTATTSPGGQATYALTFAPSGGGTTFPAAIQLNVSGLPAGATANFNPNSIPVGAGSTNLTLTVTLPAKTAANFPTRPFGDGTFPVELALLLLPFASRFRRAGMGLRRSRRVMLGALAALVMVTGLVGCGGGSSSPPQNYTLTVTATSGSFSQNTTLTLTVQ